jgi:predicted site-specific integrase-resolvase
MTTKLYSPRTLAQLRNVSTQQIYKHIKAGKLAMEHLAPKRSIITEEEAERYLAIYGQREDSRAFRYLGKSGINAEATQLELV